MAGMGSLRGATGGIANGSPRPRCPASADPGRLDVGVGQPLRLLIAPLDGEGAPPAPAIPDGASHAPRDRFQPGAVPRTTSSVRPARPACRTPWLQGSPALPSRRAPSRRGSPAQTNGHGGTRRIGTTRRAPSRRSPGAKGAAPSPPSPRTRPASSNHRGNDGLMDERIRRAGVVFKMRPRRLHRRDFGTEEMSTTRTSARLSPSRRRSVSVMRQSVPGGRRFTAHGAGDRNGPRVVLRFGRRARSPQRGGDELHAQALDSATETAGPK